MCLIKKDMKKNIALWRIVGIAIVSIALGIPILKYVLNQPLIIWDEAIYANNALEMILSGDPLVLRVNGSPDLYNTKPPLVIWLQSMSLWFFNGELIGVRLPTILSVLGLSALVVYYCRKITRSTLTGVIAVAVLCTSCGYMRPHVALTGDLDAVLTFWIAFFSFPIIYLCISKERYSRAIILSSVGFLLAFLTKSTAAMLALPSLVAVLLLSGTLLSVLKNKNLYLGILGVISVIISYYILRESMLSGYWEKVFTSEFKRYTHNVMHWHNHPFSFYFHNLVRFDYFTPYIYLLPFCILLGVIQKDKRIRKATIYLTLFSIIYLLVISVPKVKLAWYDAPVYPFMSIIIAIGIQGMISKLIGHRSVLLKIPIVLLLFAFPYYEMVMKLSHISPIYPQDYEGAAINDIRKKHADIKSYVVFMEYQEEYIRHIDQGSFYIRSYNHFKGYDISLTLDARTIQSGERVLVCQAAAKEKLAAYFEADTIYHSQNCDLLLLK